MRIYILTFLISLLSYGQENTIIGVIPTPQNIITKSVQFKITSTTKIVLGRGTLLQKFVAQQINKELELFNEKPLRITNEESVRKLSSKYIFIGNTKSRYGKKLLVERKGKLTQEMKAEGYFLDVDERGIVILADGEKGLFYGAMTLVQILEKKKRSVTVTGVTIHDYPSFKIRGIIDISSTSQLSAIERIKKVIQFCSRYKLNVYSFSVNSDENIQEKQSQEWEELDRYAKKYFVEIIPTISEQNNSVGLNSKSIENKTEAISNAFSSPYVIIGNSIGNDPQKYGKNMFLRKGEFLFSLHGNARIISPIIGQPNSLFPDFERSFYRIGESIHITSHNESLGFIPLFTNNFGEEAFSELNYYSYGWIAECAWNSVGPNQIQYSKNFFKDYFGTEEIDELRSIYILLSGSSNRYAESELWRIPIPQSDSPEEDLNSQQYRMSSILFTMPLVIELIEKANKSTTKNKEYLQYLNIIAELNLWFAHKVEIENRIKNLDRETSSTEHEQVVSMCESLVLELAQLKIAFENIWTKSYKSDMAGAFFNKFDTQINYWKEIITQIKIQN